MLAWLMNLGFAASPSQGGITYYGGRIYWDDNVSVTVQ